jgi:hypothetical protein
MLYNLSSQSIAGMAPLRSLRGFGLNLLRRGAGADVGGAEFQRLRRLADEVSKLEGRLEASSGSAAVIGAALVPSLSDLARAGDGSVARVTQKNQRSGRRTVDAGRNHVRRQVPSAQKT